MWAERASAVPDPSTVVRRSALHSSIGLVVAKAAATGTGFAFWIVAARATTDHEVGLTTAAVSAVILCTQLAVLGTGSAVIVSVGRGESPERVLNSAFGIVTVTGTVLALGFLFLQLMTADAETASTSILFWLTFLVAVVAGTMCTVLDQTLVALGRGASATIRYTVAGVLSFGAAAFLAWWRNGAGADILMVCWTFGSVVAFLIGMVQLRRLIGYRPRPSLHLAHSRSLLVLGIPNQLITLTERAPGLILPLLLALLVSPATAAYWYPAWMMAWAAYTAPMLMAIVQFSEGVRDPGRLVPKFLASFRWSLALGCVAAAVLVVFARPLLHLLGENYADSSTVALRLLAIGVVPYAVLQAYNAVCRIRGRYLEPIIVGVMVGTAVSAAALTAAELGASAMALSFLLALSGGALVVGLRLIAILRRVRREA
ncbi:polysaccharide biosynthesis protein [Arthrobacter sp. MSA 4-2]|uniref:lipopolysaccharide biosynthesis protein n=1 Tax=Arthrobacter sp. MSA 4-2 TaxID=2794349 RepID=UPI0018E79C1D|nr:polysaccharide biosynthesis protein [Arthrobacter sp. MSA 4-2]MBJ2120371.1 polysaccharide biosynthesis protein [Arthrobacter sp. MSA 4-2]